MSELPADFQTAPLGGPGHRVTTTVHKTLCGPRRGIILCREELASLMAKPPERGEASPRAGAGWLVLVASCR